MAYEALQVVDGHYIASTSFASTDQYCGVFYSTATNTPPDVRITITSGGFCNGILDDLGAETSGSAVRVVVYGKSKLRFSSTHGAIAVNDPIYVRGDGTFNNVSSSGFYPVGWSLDSLAADTSGIITGWVQPSINQRTT